MKFILHYRGQLKSNGSPQHKHEIREVFHRQLKKLWEQRPLSEMSTYLLKTPRSGDGDYSLPRNHGKFTFVPLISGEMNVVAEISIVLLRPEAPGNLITQGGDIDNRLKTLFDGLTMPRHKNSLPEGTEPNDGQRPYFYCLLEDDNLVTSIAVKTEQLLEPLTDPSIVDVHVEIITRVTRLTMENGNFA